MASKSKNYYTYILRCNDGTYYTGYTNNLKRRLKEHNSNGKTKYTRGKRLPVVLKYFEIFTTRKDAMRREREIKKYGRKKKQTLINNFNPQKLNIIR